MFDEPINGLDPDGILWIRNLMKSLASEGRTVFLSSHLMSEMAQTADHLLVIGRGRIIADASTDEFINGNAAPSVRVRALEQTDLANALTRRGALVEGSPDGAMVVTGLDAAAIGGVAVGPRHHPHRARSASGVARGGLLRPDPKRDRLPRRPAGRLQERKLT